MTPVESKETTFSSAEMQPKVNILGAGIAGLSLASHLRARQISFRIFDKTVQPRGHAYGLSLHAQALEDLPFKVQHKQETSTLWKAIAIDRLIGGDGKIPAPSDLRSASTGAQHGIRAQDVALRNLLAQHIQIVGPSKLKNINSTSQGLQLAFENETKTGPASITVDASGEQSSLVHHLLPDLKPEILPYAVYHGSRYIPLNRFQTQYQDLFEDAATHVRDFRLEIPSLPPQTSQSTLQHAHLQLSRSYIPFADLPSSIREENQQPPHNGDSKQVWVEIRYTMSRPALEAPDPLFKPDRTKEEAKVIPEQFYTDLRELLATHEDILPASIMNFFDTNQVKRDRVLNWLMRVRCLAPHDLRELAGRGVLVIGDAAHALPILGSEGACLAISDAKSLADWLETYLKHSGELATQNLYDFYGSGDMLSKWAAAETRSRAWLRTVHD